MSNIENQQQQEAVAPIPQIGDVPEAATQEAEAAQPSDVDQQEAQQQDTEQPKE
jgi:hypothetical protein